MLYEDRVYKFDFAYSRYLLIIYLMTLSVAQSTRHGTIEWLINNELKGMWKERFVDYVEVLSRHSN
jgi:hypothetical protein